MSPGIESAHSKLIEKALSKLPEVLEQLVNHSYSDAEASAITQGRGAVTFNDRDRMVCTVFAQILLRRYQSLDDEDKKAISITCKRGSRPTKNSAIYIKKQFR